MPRLRDIPQIYNPHDRGVAFDIEFMENQLTESQKYGLNLDPDFQRELVWTEEQQISYMEHLLRDGMSGRTIYFNRGPWCYKENGIWRIGDPGYREVEWQGYSQYVLVDGKQRLNACRRWVNNEIPSFGYYRKDFEEKRLPRQLSLFAVYGELKTRKEVLNWYLSLNAMGTPHTPAEIEKVRKMLAEGDNNELQNDY